MAKFVFFRHFFQYFICLKIFSKILTPGLRRWRPALRPPRTHPAYFLFLSNFIYRYFLFSFILAIAFCFCAWSFMTSLHTTKLHTWLWKNKSNLSLLKQHQVVSLSFVAALEISRINRMLISHRLCSWISRKWKSSQGSMRILARVLQSARQNICISFTSCRHSSVSSLQQCQHLFW